MTAWDTISPSNRSIKFTKVGDIIKVPEMGEYKVVAVYSHHIVAENKNGKKDFTIGDLVQLRYEPCGAYLADKTDFIRYCDYDIGLLI